MILHLFVWKTCMTYAAADRLLEASNAFIWKQVHELVRMYGILARDEEDLYQESFITFLKAAQRYTNRNNGVCIYTSQNAKIPTVDPPVRRGKTLGIFNAAFIELGEIHASPTAAAMQFSEHAPVFRRG